MPISGRDLEEARGASQTPDPIQELAGWRATPLLLRRLCLYIVGGTCECAALAAAVVVSFGWLHEGAPEFQSPSAESPSRLFRWQLAFPLAASAIRLILSLTLYVGYCGFRGTTTPGTISRRGRLQRRSFWVRSSTALLSFSCMLMLWHAVVLMVLMGCKPAEDEMWFVRCFFAFTIVSTVVHSCFCLDVAINDREPFTHDGRDAVLRSAQLENIYGMYKTGEIHISRHQEVAHAADAARGTPTPCMICMEDFGRSDWVSKLACGHYYHPACANTWLCEKWECPLRCEVASAREREKAAAQADSTASPPEHASASLQI